MPIFLISLLPLLVFNKKLKAAMKQRLWDQKNRRAVKDRPVWIHSSSGEFEYSKPLIRKLKESHPNQTVLVTHSSPSYRKAIESFQGVDHVEILPLDTPSAVKSFLNHYNPKALLLARGDLWPEMLYQAHRMQIPSLLFSFNKKEKNFFLGLGDKVLHRILFHKLSDVFGVTQDDVIYIRALAEHAAKEPKGDARYDQVKYNISQNLKPLSEIFNEGTFKASLFNSAPMPVFVAGSTWPEDEAVLIESLSYLKPLPVKVIIVPHEPTTSHLKGLEAHLSHLNLRYKRYSECKDMLQVDILIFDQVGLLSHLYAYSDMALIGGSYKSKVHSVMEALGCGVPVIVGPMYKNNREAIEFNKIKISRHLSAVTPAKNATHLRNSILQLCTEFKTRKSEINNTIQKEFDSRLGASQKVFQWLEDRLNSTN